jgi:hypothetical protein
MTLLNPYIPFDIRTTPHNSRPQFDSLKQLYIQDGPLPTAAQLDHISLGHSFTRHFSLNGIFEALFVR